MNQYDAPSLIYPIALLLSIARSTKQLRTFLYSMAAYLVAGFAVLLLLFFLPANSAGALGHLAGDAGRMAGAITAFLYSTRTREWAAKSVYLIALPFAIILLFGLAPGSF
jgi:hypothetical protein